MPVPRAAVSLEYFLLELHRKTGAVPEALQQLLINFANTCKTIAHQIQRGALSDVLGSAGSENIQGETQKRLDVLSNQWIISGHQWGGQLAGMASEEMDDVIHIPPAYPKGEYLLLFDPLDGSSNIDVNLSIGTIFSVLPAKTLSPSSTDFLQPGSAQVAAGYVLYGAQTLLVLTVKQGVEIFTLEPHTRMWLHTQTQLRIPEDTQEFAINMSNQRHWAPAIQNYVSELLAGSTGPRGKNFNMRWIAAMVADVHRILQRGGIFMYPWDAREPNKPGKLRLLYEANPMSLLIEQAGGVASNGMQPMLEIQPEQLHQRVAVFLGSRNEMRYLIQLLN